jgi:hypothetical protein
MNAILNFPAALFALLALIPLIAIYLLRNRFTTRQVSSLMLWHDHKKPKQGGLHLNRLQTPLLFILELLTIIFLVLAAATPMIRKSQAPASFVFVLDSSYSMLASSDNSPQKQGTTKVLDLLKKTKNFSARFVLAASSPQLLSQKATNLAQAAEILKAWNCTSIHADIPQALNLANEISNKAARILVITDHKPTDLPEKGHTQWWALGRALPNIAFINASRSNADTKDRCFLEIANYSTTKQTTRLIVTSARSTDPIIDKQLELDPENIRRISFDLNTVPSPITATLTGDTLDIDNTITLMPQKIKTIRVKTNIKNEFLNTHLQKAISAQNSVNITSISPHLLITDQPYAPPADPASQPPASLWTLRTIVPKDSKAYIGPFVIDYAHPLTNGLDLDGVIWSAADQKNTARPVITAGNIPLIWDRTSPASAHDITLNLNPETSTLTQSPNWPVFFFNLFHWRTSELPGLQNANIKLGSKISLTLDLTQPNAELISPDASASTFQALDNKISAIPSAPGLYHFQTPQTKYPFAVNVLAPSESNLLSAQTGKWGKWDQTELFWWEYRPLAWLLLLIALVLLIIHRFVTATIAKGDQI